MKKISYLILPAIFLSICAVGAFAQSDTTNTIKPTIINVIPQENLEAMKREMEKVKQETDATRQKIEAQRNTLEALRLEPKRDWALPEGDDFDLLLKAKKITAGEKIDLQGMLFNKENQETAEPKYYKLKLDENAQYVLLDPKTSKESKEPVSWIWNDFLGKYEYEFNFKLVLPQTRGAYLLIKITPILSKDNEPTLPVIHIAFNFNEKGDITYGGHVRAIDGHEGFESKLAVRVK